MKTRFSGKPLIKLPKDIPQIDFLEGDFGREFLAEYQGRVKRDYQDNQILRVLKESEGVVTGSNPFAVVLANQILAQEHLRTATQADLEKALKLEALTLTGTYEDTGLVLRSEGEPNVYLAIDLSRQLKARNPRVKYPVLVHLADLELGIDSNSSYGLAFKLKENAKPIYALVLNQHGNFDSEDINKSTGLPKQTGSGNRTLYTRNFGLSRLYLGGSLLLDSSYGGLAYSYSDGRVVVVSGAAAQKKSK